MVVFLFDAYRKTGTVYRIDHFNTILLAEPLRKLLRADSNCAETFQDVAIRFLLFFWKIESWISDYEPFYSEDLHLFAKHIRWLELIWKSRWIYRFLSSEAAVFCSWLNKTWHVQFPIYRQFKIGFFWKWIKIVHFPFKVFACEGA